MASAPHCSADGSGVTDWISNVTRITPVTGEDPRPWLTTIASGNDRVLTFVHEATHNWCFNSPVVHAQIYVAARAQLNAIAYLVLQDDPAEDGAGDASPTRLLQLMGAMIRAALEDPRPGLGDELKAVRDQLGMHVHDDVIRLEVVNELYRPLTEGLALFAEYDALSRIHSRAWSPLPMAVAWNFGGRERFEEQGKRGFIEPYTTSFIAGAILHDARLSEWAITTKASMLRSPFGSAGGGYLPGYLAVKSMWRFLFQRDVRLYSESDVVLTYLRAFFFDDLGMAAELLTPPINNCMRSTNQLISVFNHRLHDFFGATPADVAAFEAALDSGEPVESTGLLRTREEHRALLQEIQDRIDDLGTSTAARISGFAHSYAIGSVDELMALRRFVTVMSVDVEVDERGVVTWQGHEVLTVADDDLVRRTSGAHTLDVLLGMSGGESLSRVVVVSQDHQVHSITVLGLPDQRRTLRESLLTTFANREKRESMASHLQFTADTIVEEDSGLRMNRDHVRTNLRSVVDQLYHDTALRYSTGYEAMDRCGELMAENGLRPLLGSTETLRQTAFLGLAASLNAYRSEVDEQFRKRGMDLASLLATLRQRRAEHGFPPEVFESEDERVVLIPFL